VVGGWVGLGVLLGAADDCGVGVGVGGAEPHPVSMRTTSREVAVRSG
jgi:hypothetical protein